MAQLAPLTTPGRQPFGLLDNSKLRNLQSVKNRQNAITLSAPSLKRRHASPENSDTENVDPNLLSVKRQCSAIEDDVDFSKVIRSSFTTVMEQKPRPIITPRLGHIHTQSAAPSSAPAAAGRSPTHGKRSGILNKRQRFAPPSFVTKSPSLSLAAALNGTLANKRPKRVRTLEDSKPKSWFFDIYEEGQEQQDYRMNEWTMTQSAKILDISDDESKAKAVADRGKENVDPKEVTIPVTRSMAAAKAAAASLAPKRADKLTDEVRSPLGDLNPADYFAAGHDATSVVLIHDDVEEALVPEGSSTGQTKLVVEEADFAFQATSCLPSTADAPEEDTLSTAQIGALLVSSAPVWDTETLVSSPQHPEYTTDDDLMPMSANVDGNATDIEIWESESAKDESESREAEGESETIFALQEL